MLLHYGNAVATGIPPWYCQLRFAFGTTGKPNWSDPERHQTYSITAPAGRERALNAAWEIGAKKTGTAQEEYVRKWKSHSMKNPSAPSVD